MEDEDINKSPIISSTRIRSLSSPESKGARICQVHHLYKARSSVFNCLGETNEVQSFVPSCVKCIFILDIKTDGSLKVNRCTLVITSCEASLISKAKIEGE